MATLLESVVRTNGGVPATIGIFNGIARVGLEAEELVGIASAAQTRSALKVSRRDLGYICGLVSSSQAKNHQIWNAESPGRVLQGKAYMEEPRFQGQWSSRIWLVSKYLELVDLV